MCTRLYAITRFAGSQYVLKISFSGYFKKWAMLSLTIHVVYQYVQLVMTRRIVSGWKPFMISELRHKLKTRANYFGNNLVVSVTIKPVT
jgi:hypothetical protein